MSEHAIGAVVHDALDVFKTAYKKIRFCKLKNVVFILGNTNLGKTALRQLTTDSAKSLFSDSVVQNSVDKEDIFPQFELDFATNEVFYHLPTLNDNESVPYDLSGTFFTQEVINYVDAAKLIFVVNYNSVTDKGNYNDFMVLAKKTVRMIKNIDDYKHSIALIVADVPKMYKSMSITEKKVVILSDENIIDKISDFLKGVRDHVQSIIIASKQHCFAEIEHYKNIAKFVNFLLSHDGKTYKKIGIFRKHSSSDLFSNDILSESCKKCVRNIIQNELQSSKIDERYFNLYISSDSQKYVSELIRKIDESITFDIAKIIQEIKDHYHDQEKDIHDIDKIYKEFDIGYASFSKISKTTLIDIEDFIQQLANNIIKLNINISKSYIINILHYDKYSKFAERFNHQLSESVPLQWEGKLTDLIEYLNYSKEWYRFLISLHATLSKSEVQLNVASFAVYENELKQLYLNQNEISLSRTKLHEFFNKINFNITDYNLASLQINKSKLDFLQRILIIAFGNNVNLQCNDNTLLIMDDYVKLSDVVIRLNICKAKIIKVFALNSVFVDTDLDKTGDQAQIFIMAPTLHVIGNRKIVLDGADGSLHNPTIAKFGISPGVSGSNGLPGKPGSHAGNFLGIFENIINGSNLTISAKGGNGGLGQDGGDGADGKEIKTIVPKRTIYMSDYPEFDCPNPEKVKHRYYGYNDRCHFESACTHAGKGGDGGKGGKEGNGGFIKLFELNTTSQIVMNNETAEAGQDGRGGKGGQGKREVLILDWELAVRSYTNSLYYLKVVSQKNVKCSEATNGTTGGNLNGIKSPEPAIKGIHLATVINEYKNYLIENLSNNIKESTLKNFVSNFENHQPIKDLYDTLGYVNERQGLEKRYYNLHQKLSFLPFYKSLLSRIIYHADKLGNKGDLMIQEKTILGFLYISTLGKIHNLVKNKPDDILAISEYLKLVVNNIEELEDLQKIVSVKNYKNSYQKEIKEEIREALSSIQKEITPEINRQFDEVNNKIELLLNNVIELQNENRKEKDELRKKQEQLTAMKYLRLMLGVVKAASMLLFFTGPVGMAAGSVVIGILSTTEMLAFDDTSGLGTDKVTPLPIAIKNNVGKVTELLKNKQMLLKHQLHDANKKIEKFLDDSKDEPSEDLHTLKAKISDIESKINEASPADVKIMRQKAMDLIEKEKEILEKKTKYTDRYVDTKTRLVNNIQQGIAITEVSFEIYGKYKNDDAKLKALSEVINQKDVEMKVLEEVEEEIYQKLMPVCRQMENAANDLERDLKDKSQVALDIKNLQMQSSLEDVKAMMEKLMTGIDLKEDVATSINHIINAINTMVKTYNRIQDYSKQEKLINYFTDIISKKSGPIENNDTILNEAIDNLNLIIQSNVVLDQYRALIEVIKQDLYPFVDDYFAEFNLPNSLQFDDFKSLIKKAVTEIKSLQKKISTSDFVSKHYSHHVYTKEEFHSRSKTTLPFFVWENENYANDINELLEGKEITIKSDITTSKLKKNAVKFTGIGINFKIANEDIQTRLNEELEDFSVTMIHPGYSYYRCEDYVHIIKNLQKNISYSFELKGRSLGNSSLLEPLHSNQIYKELKSHNARLSPFTVWTIKLDNKNNNFTVLKKYKNYPIDLELIGDGQYVERGIGVCTEDLNKYFILEDDILPDDDATRLLNDISILNDVEYHRRTCRSLGQCQLSQDVEENLLVFNGAGSIGKHSFVNSVLNFMSVTLLIFDYFNPVSKIKQWFDRNENNIDEDFVMLDENKIIDVKLMNILPEKPRIAKVPLEDKSYAGYISDALDYSLLYNNSNLMLLDLIIRQKNGMKYKNTKFVLGKNEDSEYSQTLAYRQYAPEHNI